MQRNPYKGITPRCWVTVRFTAADGSLHERELLADTGSPCAVILGSEDLAAFFLAAATGMKSNFGDLAGGWLRVDMPEMEGETMVLGYGSDQVLQAVQSDSASFAGLVGLPLLRLMEYGGDGSSFWLRRAGESSSEI